MWPEFSPNICPMKRLQTLIEGAHRGGFGLKKLNVVLRRGIPFNRPHRIRLLKVDKDEVQALIPYRKKNRNHIKGIHACGLATVCEFSSGMLLLRRLGVKEYRLIMESMEMTYHYQAKMDAIATFKLSDDAFKTQVLDPLEKADRVHIRCQVECYDTAGNHLCTGCIRWQIKPWNKVKTKLK